MKAFVAVAILAFASPVISQQVSVYTFKRVPEKEAPVPRAPDWLQYEDALALARKSRKTILLYFTAKW